MKTTVIYPGTFDPLTYGHLDLIKRACRLFDHVIIAIAASNNKSPVFSLPERLKITQEIFSHETQISVYSFGGLIVDFMREHDVKFLLRGIRTVSDMELEFQLATMNRTMFGEMETIFLTPDAKYAYISSTIVREIAKMGGDLSPFVPQEVVKAFTARLK